MKNFITALLITISLSACSQERIEEDDPRWNCHTMGNKVCGPEANQ